MKNAGRLITLSGEKVLFVAHPEKYTGWDKCCRPDSIRDGTDGTWREYLKSYNQQGSNPNNLFPAGDLYKPSIYKALVEKYDAENVFILSAGGRLIRSDFLIPLYDITFSDQGEPYSKRGPRDQFEDFNQLSEGRVLPDETIYFFGGQAYLPLYCNLTNNITARKVIDHSQGDAYQIQGYECIHFGNYTNWHYVCAQNIIDDTIQK